MVLSFISREPGQWGPPRGEVSREVRSQVEKGGWDTGCMALSPEAGRWYWV